MTPAIQWINPRQQGLLSSIDVVYAGSEPLESFDLSMAFAPDQIKNLTVTGYSGDWTILSNATSAGNWQIAGMLNPLASFKSGQNLFTLQLDTTSGIQQALSFMYSGDVNANTLPPDSYTFESGNSSLPTPSLPTPSLPTPSPPSVTPATPVTPPASTPTAPATDSARVPLQTTTKNLTTTTAWISDTDGKITIFDDTLPANITTSSFHQVASPLELKATLSQATTVPTLRVYLDQLDTKAGYWVHTQSGSWVNLTSTTQGGSVLPGTNTPTLLQFKAQDGGVLDADGTVNGQITLIGVVGNLSIELTGKSSDVPALFNWI